MWKHEDDCDGNRTHLLGEEFDCRLHPVVYFSHSGGEKKITVYKACEVSNMYY